MCLHDSALEGRPSLRPSHIAALRLAASQMRGPKRRACEAEMAVQSWGAPPIGRTPFWVGAPDRGAWLGGETHRAHVSWGALGRQWTHTRGRPVPASGCSAASARRGAGAPRPDVSHERPLHAADGPRGLAGAPSAGGERGARARAPYQGRRRAAAGLSVTPGGAGQAPQEGQRDQGALRPEQPKEAHAGASGSGKRLRRAGQATVPSGE